MPLFSTAFEPEKFERVIVVNRSANAYVSRGRRLINYYRRFSGPKGVDKTKSTLFIWMINAMIAGKPKTALKSRH